MTNIAVVVLDTLRKDAFDRHFDWLPGRRFDRAFSTANWTVPAHASLFTGQYASEVGVHAKSLQFDCREPALPEALADAGYTTRAFSANTNVTSHFAFDKGFSEFLVPDRLDHLVDENRVDWREFSRTTDATGLRRYLLGVSECLETDVATFSSLLSGLRVALRDGHGGIHGGAAEATETLSSTSFGDREFLFLNLMEAHEPFRVPEAYRTVPEPPLVESIGEVALAPIDGSQVTAAYEDCVRYLSDAYRDLFRLLDQEFEYVLTLSDHGELLGEHGAWGHEHGVYPELTQVPLCLSGPGVADQCGSTVSLLDVHATVLDLAGLDTHESRGRSLLEVDAGREYLTEFHGLTPWSEQKLARNDFADRVPRYDEGLRGYATDRNYYCYQTTDGLVEEGTADGVGNPRERMGRLVDGLSTRDIAGGDGVPEEVRSRLRELGYA